MTQLTYFVTAGSYVKIGSTKNIVSRVAQIRTHCPYRVTDVVVTDQITEREAHRNAIRRTTRVGEWFRINGSLTEWILGLAGLVRVSAIKRNGRIKVLPLDQAELANKSCEVALADLPETTKDYLISLHTATGRPIAELIRELLNRTAEKQGGEA